MGSFENARHQNEVSREQKTHNFTYYQFLLYQQDALKMKQKYPRDSSKRINFMLLENAHKHPNSPQQLPIYPSSFSTLSQLPAKASSGTFHPFLAQQKRMNDPDLTETNLGCLNPCSEQGLPPSTQAQHLILYSPKTPQPSLNLSQQNSPHFKLSTNYSSLFHKKTEF